MKRSSRAGFTLIEVMVVTVIMAIVSLAIFAVFVNGLRIFNRISKQAINEDAAMFCDRFGQDLRNAFSFTGIAFSGREKSVEFASMVPSVQLKARTVGMIRYEYNPETQMLSRFVSDYAAVADQAVSSRHQSLSAIASCVFFYYYYDKDRKEVQWLPEWTKKELPRAVRMEIEYKDAGFGRLVRTFPIMARTIGE